MSSGIGGTDGSFQGGEKQVVVVANKRTTWFSNLTSKFLAHAPKKEHDMDKQTYYIYRT